MADTLTAFLHSPHYTATPSNTSFATLQTFVLSPSIQWLSVFFRTLAFVVAAPIMFFAALDIAAYLIARTLGAPHHHQRESHLVKVPAYAARDHLDNPAIIISPAATNNIEPSSLSSALSNLQNQLPKASCSSGDRPHHLPTPPEETASSSSSSTRSTLNLASPKLPLHFTTPSEGNFALSGEGIFSPPESRAGSPPPSEAGSRIKEGYKSRARAASIGVEALGAITDSTDNEEDDTDSASSSAGTSGGPTGKVFLSATPMKGAALRKRKPGLQFTPVR
ncbi:hypothetical protein FS837_007391 [Tulasnella sp. UAMH 9824]|nr:hypothetical protein FS837_007391 [Tulasnella sp. UAMH 9824]